MDYHAITVQPDSVVFTGHRQALAPGEGAIIRGFSGDSEFERHVLIDTVAADAREILNRSGS